MSNNTYENINEELSVNNNGARPSSYGEWSDKRKLALIDAMISYHPFSVKRGGVTAAWKSVIAEVNTTDAHLKDLGESTIKNKVDSLIEDTKKKVINDKRESGTNDSETTLDNRVLTLISMVNENN